MGTTRLVQSIYGFNYYGCDLPKKKSKGRVLLNMLNNSYRLIVVFLAAASLCAQPQTFVVKVNSDGSFTPKITYIKSGDTIRWEQLTRTDSIIRADGSK